MVCFLMRCVHSGCVATTISISSAVPSPDLPPLHDGLQVSPVPRFQEKIKLIFLKCLRHGARENHHLSGIQQIF